MDQAELAQMQEDAKLAERLQREEYSQPGKEQRSQRHKETRKQESTKDAKEKPAKSKQTWAEWLGYGTPAPAPAKSPRSREETATSSASKPGLYSAVTDSVSAAMGSTEDSAVVEVEEDSGAEELVAVPKIGRSRG
jgi:hypothetical protein